MGKWQIGSIGGGICPMVIPYYIEHHPHIKLALLCLGIALITIPILLWILEKCGFKLINPLQKISQKKLNSFSLDLLDTHIEFEIAKDAINGKTHTNLKEVSRSNIKHCFHPNWQSSMNSNGFQVMLFYIQFEHPTPHNCRLNFKDFGHKGLIVSQPFGAVGKRESGFEFDVIEIRIPLALTENRSLRIFYDQPKTSH